MRYKKLLSAILFLTFLCSNTIIAQQKDLVTDIKASFYNIVRLNQPLQVDGNWDKPQWQNIKAIEIINFIRVKPKFRPSVKAKMMYDDENIYVIFRVQDRYVLSTTKDINGRVWEDSAVEFFFSPDTSLPENFFNLEVNCGGTPKLGYQSIPRIRPEVSDVRKIEIGHSLPQIVDPEITEPVTWTIECRIPLVMLEKYSNITRPKQSVKWRANFYKIAEKNSNPHYITWSIIDHPEPHFHMPRYFGTIEFQ